MTSYGTLNFEPSHKKCLNTLLEIQNSIKNSELMNIVTQYYYKEENTITFLQGWFIETINWKDLSESELERICEIERDMWSHGLWEYTQCNSCWNIDGKYDMDGESSLYWKKSKNLLRETVSDIERILNIQKKDLQCTKCWDSVEYIFPVDTYIDDISSRYEFNTSFLSLYRDYDWKICGFMDGYVSDINSIYSREFENYYSHVWKTIIRKKMEAIIQQKLPKELLCITALWTDQNNASMLIVYELMKAFFNATIWYNPYLYGTYESILWTNTQAIYEICWWKRIYSLDHHNVSENIKKWLEWDIFIHPYIWVTSMNVLWEKSKNFMKNNITQIKKILENCI